MSNQKNNNSNTGSNQQQQQQQQQNTGNGPSYDPSLRVTIRKDDDGGTRQKK